MKLFSLLTVVGANRHIQHKIENGIDIERGIDDRYIFQFPRCSDAKCSNIYPRNFQQKGKLFNRSEMTILNYYSRLDLQNFHRRK